MGLFSNPLSYAGYPPGVQAPATVVNSSVRASTAAEAAAGTSTNTYISPATAESATALDFASPPVLGFGSTTPRPVHATTLDSTLNSLLTTSAAATAVAIANIAPSAARTGDYHGGNSAQNDTVTWLGGAPSAGTQSFRIFGGVITGGTQSVGLFTGNSAGGTQSFSVLSGTRAGTINLGTGAAAHVLNLGSSASLLGFFGATAVVKPIGTDDLRVALINLGLYTTGGASPLNLNGGAFSAGTVTAATAITATTGNIVASTGNITSTLGSVGAATTVTAGTTITATLGNITASNGNFVSSTAGKGLQFAANTNTGAAAGPVILNSRAGQVIFTSVSIAAAADLTLTITNSSVTASTTQVIYSISGATTGSALSIKSVTNSSGSSEIVVTNGTGATTTTADITVNFIVVN